MSNKRLHNDGIFLYAPGSNAHSLAVVYETPRRHALLVRNNGSLAESKSFEKETKRSLLMLCLINSTKGMAISRGHNRLP